MHKIAMITSGEERLPAGIPEKIRQFAELRCQRCESPAALVEFAKDCEILWMFGPNIAMKPEALDQMPLVKALFRSGSGLDALPLDYAKEHGMGVYNTPESIAESVAEHAVSLLISLIRQIPMNDRKVREGYTWGKVENMNWHISGRTLGLVGYGNIARRVEAMMQGFRMKVLHYDPFLADSTPLDTLLAEADYVSLHCPLTPETRHLINRERLALMKKNALLVNTSRGPVIDEEALVEALKNHTIGGAALDVLCDEDHADGNPLYSCDNVIVTPHIAAFSADFEKNFWECSVEKLKKICADLDR